MMKKLVLFFAIASFTQSCWFIRCEEGKGTIITETFSFDNINEIDVGLGNCEVTIKQTDDKPHIKITTYENLFQFLEIEGKAGEIDIDSKNCFKTDKIPMIELLINDLEELKVSGSADIQSTNTLRLNDFELKISGSGDVNLDLITNELNCKINGSGDVLLSGKGYSTEIKINGSGDVNAYNFETHEAEVSINGSGDVKITSTEKLNAKINGSGNIFYKGDPQHVTSKINGSGAIDKR